MTDLDPLPTVTWRGIIYAIDMRKRELQALANPHVRLSVDDFTFATTRAAAQEQEQKTYLRRLPDVGNRST